MQASASPRNGVLALYRSLLRNAKVYPSKNRGRIITDIKQGFRSNVAVTDVKKIAAEIAEAKQGLKMMSGINNMMTGGKKDWSVTIGAEWL